MQIKVLKVDVSTVNKGTKSYKIAEVSYKNNADGKVASKKLLDFAGKEVFNTFATAAPDAVYDVVAQKDSNGYWQWTGATAVTTSATITADGKPEKKKVGDWETSEERQARQSYIVRQSSLERAIDLLSFNKAGNKGMVITVPEVIEVAKQFEAYVFGKDFTDAAASAMAGIMDMENDVPA
jgi:hypothetical protein